ncbi:hypothetical protein BGZ63DRAFT_387420 [Mariannaea sp. PMI_226]|nr:hypothetical protein BGZ63DRAFT_387420 [Mariannaea sp. PMI_226]
MRCSAPLAPLLVSLSALALSASGADSGGTIWATPHDSYSSSIGVLGCKVDVNRIAYWPNDVDCSNFCVEVTYEDRSLYLLRIDQSQGAHDISYDAWNYLYTGSSATKKPTTGGAVEMTYKDVEPSKCKHLIDTKHGKLPLSASNSMNFLASCLDQNTSWVGDNYVLYNIDDAICTLGYNEECDLDWPNANQASCPHTLGLQVALNGLPVFNIAYPSGKKILATNGSVSITTPTTGGGDDNSASGHHFNPSLMLVMLFSCFLCVSTSWWF